MAYNNPGCFTIEVYDKITNSGQKVVYVTWLYYCIKEYNLHLKYPLHVVLNMYLTMGCGMQ